MSGQHVYHYAVLQRWELYGEWPKRVCFKGEWEKDTIETATGNVAIRKHIVACNGAFPIPGSDKKSFRVFYTRMHNPDAMYIGESIVCSDTIDMELVEQDAPAPNDIELGVVVSSDIELNSDELERHFAPVIARLSQFLQAYLSGIALKKSSVTVFRFDGDSVSQQRRIQIRVADHVTVSISAAKQAILAFQRFEPDKIARDKFSISSAARRYMESLAESDLVDRYCDLWECCEFLGKLAFIPNRTSQKGIPIEQRVSSVLSRIFGVDEREILKTLVKSLYIKRNEMVHNANDYIEAEEDINVLEKVALTLLRDAFGLLPDKEVFEYLAARIKPAAAR